MVTRRVGAQCNHRVKFGSYGGVEAQGLGLQLRMTCVKMPGQRGLGGPAAGRQRKLLSRLPRRVLRNSARGSG